MSLAENRDLVAVAPRALHTVPTSPVVLPASGSGMAARQARKPNAGCPYMQPACGLWIGLPAAADIDMDPVAVAAAVRVGRSV